MSASDEIIHELIRKVTLMEREIQRISSLNPLYQILNTNEPATITTTQNAYDPGDYDFLALTATPAISLNGIAGGTLGRVLLIRLNGTSSNITLVHNSGSAIAANRIFTYTGANIALTARQAALMIYATAAGSTGWLVLMSS